AKKEPARDLHQEQIDVARASEIAEVDPHKHDDDQREPEHAGLIRQERRSFLRLQRRTKLRKPLLQRDEGRLRRRRRRVVGRVELVQRDLLRRLKRAARPGRGQERRDEHGSLQRTLSRAGVSPFTAYRNPPGRFPTMPSATKRTDSANAGALATPIRVKNQTNAA